MLCKVAELRCFVPTYIGNSGETKAGVKSKSTVSRLETIRDMLDIIFRGGGQTHAKYYRVSFSTLHKCYFYWSSLLVYESYTSSIRMIMIYGCLLV